MADFAFVVSSSVFASAAMQNTAGIQIYHTVIESGRGINMSAVSVVIENTLEAIRDGRIPGKFSADRKVFTFPTVTSASSRGKPLLWWVTVELTLDGAAIPIREEFLTPGAVLGAGHQAVVTSYAKQEGSKKPRIAPRYVDTGKNLGKKNATNVVTQAFRDALGDYNTKARKAPKPSPINVQVPDAGEPAAKDAKDAKTPAPDVLIGRVKKPAPAADGKYKDDSVVFDREPAPMLVKKLGDTADATLGTTAFKQGITLQRKYDGARIVAYLADGEVKFYSRTKSSYKGSPAIATELKEMLLAARAPSGAPAAPYAPLYGEYTNVYVDAEIYKHGVDLATISGQSRRKTAKGNEEDLELRVYDCFFPAAKARGHDLDSAGRQLYLDTLVRDTPHIKRVENFRPKSLEEMNTMVDGFIADGYEGGIARKDWCGYEYGTNNRHSSNLVKVKPVHDAEYTVVGYTEGKKGKDVGAVVWVCRVDEKNAKDPNDAEFNVVPKDMTYETRYALFKLMGEKIDGKTQFEREIKGLPLTVEYAGLSKKTGKPLQAKAKVFRTYEGGPENDPIAKLLAKSK